jgi:hypothetical protein
MADKTSKNPTKTDLTFKVAFDGKPDKETKLTAYAFDVQGNLLASAPVSEGQAQLSIDPAQARHARIFFAPAEAEGAGKATIESVEKSRGYEASWRFDPRSTVYEISAIPEPLWKYWIWCMCRVRGRVVKPVTIGGTTQDLPVCRARVHICEVDWWPDLILRLPDDIVFRLRDEWLRALQEPIRWPIPIPDPPPFKFDPRVLDPSPANIAEVNRSLLPEASRGISSGIAWRALNPQPLPPKASARFASPGTIRAFNPQPDPPLEERFRSRAELVELNPQPEPPGVQALSMLSLETRIAASSQSSSLVKSALIDNARLIRPYLCYWDWFWYWYRCDEVGLVNVDEQGRFDTTIWYRCFVDEPDLYFWVEYYIDGAWTTVYRPTIACHTYWNYECGTEVTIRVTDPRVVPCSPPPDLTGLQVAVMSIGNGVSMHEIQGAAALASEGLTTAGEPFGGVLEPHVFFSRSALFAIGITHYRWSYRRLTLSDGLTAPAVPDTWHSMDRAVVRHYAVIDPGTGDLSFPADPMGPDPAYPGRDLFRIQPLNPPAGIDWYPADAREDLASAFFQTHLLAGGNAEAGAGKYELKLELFNPTVSPVNPVNLTAAGVQFKVPTVDAPFGTGTIPTTAPTAEHLILDGGNLVAFRVVVRVDNNVCEAEIYSVTNPPAGTGLTVDINCGFIEYSPNDSVPARVSFRAHHPHNFASFQFTIYRGASIYVPEGAASGLVGVSPINGFNRDSSSVYTKDISCHTLLTSNKPPGSPDCQKAAFAENLYVWAMATDGWSTLWYLNASGTPKAFALAPHP